jgi:hypothetical protein
MKKIALFVLLAAVAAVSAQAQEWPLSNVPYLCRWQTASNPSGKALVTINFTSTSPDGLSKSGTIKTVYPNASSLDVPIRVDWNWATWTYTSFNYTQTQNNVTCTLTTSGNGSTASWTGCSNGNSQQCFQ